MQGAIFELVLSVVIHCFICYTYTPRPPHKVSIKLVWMTVLKFSRDNSLDCIKFLVHILDRLFCIQNTLKDLFSPYIVR